MVTPCGSLLRFLLNIPHEAVTREPAPLHYFERIRPGDVGYIHRGCFNLLFSAGLPLGDRRSGVDVPDGFRQLDVGPILNAEPQSPGSFRRCCQRCYDLLFLRLENPKTARLTAAVRWGVSNSKILTHEWKSPVPTQVIGDYLADERNDRPALSTPKDWVEVVSVFLSRRDHLDNASEPEPEPPSLDYNPWLPRNDGLWLHSRASSRSSSITEGHASPEYDVPSKKVVRYGD